MCTILQTLSLPRRGSHWVQDYILWTLTIILLLLLLVMHQGVVTVMRPVLPPTVVIEDFDWQTTHLIAPLKHFVPYFGNPGVEASVSSTVCLLLSSSKPINVGT